MFHVPAVWLLLWWGVVSPAVSAPSSTPEWVRTDVDADGAQPGSEATQPEVVAAAAGPRFWEQPWAAGTLVGGTSALLMALLGPLLLVPPLLCVLPLAGIPVAAVAAVTAWGMAWALGRRVPLGGLLLSGGLAGLLGGLTSAAFAGVALAVFVGALTTNGGPLALPLFLATAPLMLVAGVAWLMALLLWGGAVTALTGPCARPLLAWESPWNLDVLGAPQPDHVRPPWMTELERRARQPGWEEPQKQGRHRRARPTPKREEE